VIGTSPPTFQCSSCNSKNTTLARMFGTWPLPDFKELPQNVQQEFWATAASTKEGLQKSVEHMLCSRVVERQLASDLGTFLPLEQYRTQFGWSEKLIKSIEEKAPCEDHVILGKTYQVQLHSTGTQKHRDMVREMMCKLLERGDTARASSSSGQAKTLKDTVMPATDEGCETEGSEASADTDGSSDGNTSDDTSDSSEESDKGRKQSKKSKQKKTSQQKKKETKSKKEKKRSKKSKKQAVKKAAAEKRQRDAEKKEKARVQKVKAVASKVVAKLAPDMVGLEHTLKTAAAKSSDIPLPLQKKIKSDYADVKAFYDEAIQKMKAKDPLDLTFDLSDVISVMKTAAHTKSCVMSMLTTLDNLCPNT